MSDFHNFRMLTFNTDKFKYRELKDHGFEFQKLYAGNYMQWCKRLTEFSTETVRVWKMQDEVCLADWHEKSGVIAEYIRDIPADTPIKYGCIHMVYNLKTYSIEEYDREKHNSGIVFSRNEGKPNEDELMDDWYNTYRVINITIEFARVIRELWKLDMIKITEKTFKLL
jgi:hypothetical protein